MSWNFRKVTFSESDFPVDTSVLDTRYERLGSQNNNWFYLFNDQLDYALANNFAKSKTTKYNIDKFLSNLLIKPIIKKLSYWNANE